MSLGENDDSKILFDVKQCEELYQRDKSDKMHQDILECKQRIKEAKEEELQFYQSIKLNSSEKQRIFRVDGNERQQNNMVIVWDPVEGNLIMTKEEYEKKYKN